MVPQVATMLGNMFIELLKMVDRIFTELNGWDFYMSAFIIFTISRFLLMPFLRGGFGGVGSDLAKKVVNETIYSDSRGSSDRTKGEK